MSDIHSTDERRHALDQFAASSTPPAIVSPSVQPMASPGDRVFGAQAVAVYRDETRILQKLAALGAAAGDDWFYRFPVKDRGRTTYIEGPSIKLANDVARIYGNCEVDTRVIDLGSSWLIYARFTDFETGYALTRPFQQNKNASKLGGSDNDRRLDIAFQIGVSKAIRNVVSNALQTFADYAFNAARNSLIEKIGKDIKRYRDRVVQGIANQNIQLLRVERVIGRSAPDWTAPDIAKVIAMMKSIADGMATVDDTFPDHDPSTGEVKDQTTSESITKNSDETDAHAGSSEAEQGEVDSNQAQAEPGSATTSSSSSRVSSQQPVSDQAAAKSSPSKEKDKAAAKAGEDKAKKATDDDGEGAPPKNEAEYIAFATKWIDELDDAAAGEARWKAEKSLRNKANVGSDQREELQTKLAAKCADIRDADRS